MLEFTQERLRNVISDVAKFKQFNDEHKTLILSSKLNQNPNHDDYKNLSFELKKKY